MNREDALEIAAIMVRYGNGEDVQVSTGDGEWQDCKFPSFGTHLFWRVKPAPKKYWITLSNEGIPITTLNFRPLTSEIRDAEERGMKIITVQEIKEND
jgi:hypothetical protein